MTPTPTERVLMALSSLEEADIELAAKFVETLARRTERRARRAAVRHRAPPGHREGGTDAS